MKLSVIVCTRNRRHAILACLDSIAAAFAQAAPLDAEIVVVDNGSTDDTQSIVKAWASTCAFPVSLVFEGKRGHNVARNTGVATAGGDLLVFTDDDCRLSLDYVRDVLRRDAEDSDPVVRGGRVELGDPTDLPLTIHTAPTARRYHRDANCRLPPNTIRGRAKKLIVSSVIGANMATRRDVAHRIGPFDPCCEQDETDWLFRAYLAGIAVEYVPDMVVFHHHGRKSASQGYNTLRLYAMDTGTLYVKYLFRAPSLCFGQLCRDIGGSVKELFFGVSNKNFKMCGFSRRVWLGYCVLGAYRYLSLAAGVQLRHRASSRSGS